MGSSSVATITGMLPSAIAMSKVRDTGRHLDVPGLQPLDARSIALSVLLGSHPPVLPARALVALAELFGIAGGTMRTALSRMVAAGELAVTDGRYRLAGRLLDRQRAQDIGRRGPGHRWDGSWHTVVAARDQRDLSERRRFRARLTEHRFGELRPDIWMRPANLDPPPAEPDVIVTSGALSGADPVELCARLWDLDALDSRGRALLTELRRLVDSADWADPRSIPAIFTLSAAVVRHLRGDPLLPVELSPDSWPAAALRIEYDCAEQRLQHLLRGFLSAAA
jgi:phenylacetic acid degradation operon negative regulatory protein